MGWLFDLFVAPGVTYQEIADTPSETLERQVGELREPGVAEGMSDAEIAEEIRRFAIFEAYVE